MNIRYLGHSGFFIETPLAYYLFDYIRGELPEMSSDKPLYVFASHAHADHFDPRIFALTERAAHFILGTDIRKADRRKHLIPEQAKDRILWAECGQTIPLPECTVQSLKSTDEGAAFVITEAGGDTFYHAGDLNWWHWEGESHAWNRNMEVNFKREIDRLKTLHLKAAFLPLDPRQEGAYHYGMDYFLKNVAVNHVFPMHFWEQYDIISTYIAAHGHCDAVIHQIKKENEDYEI